MNFRKRKNSLDIKKTKDIETTVGIEVAFDFSRLILNFRGEKKTTKF